MYQNIVHILGQKNWSKKNIYACIFFFYQGKMKTKLWITRKRLINAKNVIDEKRFRIIFYIRIRIQKYQNPILCHTET